MYLIRIVHVAVMLLQHAVFYRYNIFSWLETTCRLFMLGNQKCVVYLGKSHWFATAVLS